MVLAEDSYLVREGVRRLLETDPDIELTSCCVDLKGLLAAVERDQGSGNRGQRGPGGGGGTVGDIPQLRFGTVRPRVQIPVAPRPALEFASSRVGGVNVTGR